MALEILGADSVEHDYSIPATKPVVVKMLSRYLYSSVLETYVELCFR